MIDALFPDCFNMILNRVLLTKQNVPSSSLKIKMQQTEMARGDYFPLRQSVVSTLFPWETQLQFHRQTPKLLLQERTPPVIPIQAHMWLYLHPATRSPQPPPVI